MPAQFRGPSYRRRFFKLIAPWIFLTAGLVVIRISKGAFFSDFYALISRPFWQGVSQKEWIYRSLDAEQQAKLVLLEQDNRRLRLLLSLDKRSSKNGYLSAAVISRQLKGWWHQLELGQGSLNGISKGDPVVGPGGLIGSINSVTPTTSRVLLLTAPSSRVAVWISRIQRHGILVGRGSSRPHLVFLDKNPQVLPGDLVSISPASSIMPSNLPVGVIQSIDFGALPSPYALVQLIAAPQAIDWVQVKIR